MTARKITSPANKLVKQTVEIAMRSRRADDSLFIAEGTHLVGAALAASSSISEIFYTSEYGQTKEGKELLRKLVSAAPCSGEIIEVPGNVFSKMSDAESPQGILAVVSSRSMALNDIQLGKTPLLAVCDGISDPGNLGAIVRISDAAGADAVIILPGCCDPYSPKAVRATAGSVFNLPLVRAGQEELVDFLAIRAVRLYVADVRAEKSLYDTDLTVPSGLVIGNESRGVAPFILDKAQGAVKIPMAGRAESLNAAVSAAICLYEAVRQRNLASSEILSRESR
jgi:RNA methyltransferase, TrmH family